MNTKSTSRSFLATLALFAFASVGSACDFTAFPQPGNPDVGSRLTSPTQVVPCNPPVERPLSR